MFEMHRTNDANLAMFSVGYQRFTLVETDFFVTLTGEPKMVVVITHVKRRGNRIIEIGQKLGRIELWRKTAVEAIALYRAGMRFVLKPKDGDHAIEVVVQPSTLQTEAELRTVADKAFDRKLLSLPDLD